MSTTEIRIKALEKEIATLRNELDGVRRLVKVKTLVKSTVAGPRLSDVFVEAQAMPLSGRFTRTGEREIEIDGPNIDLFVALKGQAGTAVVITTEINKKTKEQKLTTKKEKEFHQFTYTTDDFNL